MSAFSSRSKGYQTGVLLLYISTILFVIGIVSPMWLVWNREIPNIREEKMYAGILVGCRYNLRLVGANSFDYTRCSFGFADVFDEYADMSGWVHVVEAFEIISALALVFACIYAALFNCFIEYPGQRTRILEIITAVAGLVAFIFCMVFVGKLRYDVERSVFFWFSWAYYLSVVSAISAMVAAVIIALFNEYIPPPADYNYSNLSLSKPAPPSTVNYFSHLDELYDPRIAAQEQHGGFEREKGVERYVSDI